MRLFNVSKSTNNGFGYGGGVSILVVADTLEEAVEFANNVPEQYGEMIYDDWSAELSKKGDWISLGYWE